MQAEEVLGLLGGKVKQLNSDLAVLINPSDIQKNTKPDDISLNNLLDSYGNLATATSGTANGFVATSCSNLSCTNGVQTFTPNSTSYGLQPKNSTIQFQSKLAEGDKVVACCWMKTAEAGGRFQFYGTGGHIGNTVHRGSGKYEFVMLAQTITALSSFQIYLKSRSDLGVQVPISVKKIHLFKVNDINYTDYDDLAKIIKGAIIKNDYILNQNVTPYEAPFAQIIDTQQDFTAEITLTSVAGRCGMFVCADDPSYMLNGLAFYYDSNEESVKVDKYLGGNVTTEISESITFVSGQKLILKKQGGTFTLYYNDVSKGEFICKDLSIIYNTKSGLYDIGTNVFVASPVSYELTKKDYLTRFMLASDTHIGYESWGNYSALNKLFEKLNIAKDLDFAMFTGDSLDSGYTNTPDIMSSQLAQFKATTSLYKGDKKVFAGNHDKGVSEFEHHGVIDINGVRIIYFWADYQEISAEPRVSTGLVSNEEITWIETQLQQSKAKHNILVCHYAIADVDADFIWSILDTGNKQAILTLAETYGVKLYINGHEHNYNYPTKTAGVMTNINGGSLLHRFSIVTIKDTEAVFDVYYSAYPYGYVKTVTVPLT